MALLVKKNLIHDRINLIIKEVNNKLSTTEKIRKFIIVQDDFTQENGLLTPTMKIKKSLVFEKFKKQIENFFYAIDGKKHQLCSMQDGYNTLKLAIKASKF